MRAEADPRETALPAGMEVRTAAAVPESNSGGSLDSGSSGKAESRETAVLVEKDAEKQRKRACKGSDSARASVQKRQNDAAVYMV